MKKTYFKPAVGFTRLKLRRTSSKAGFRTIGKSKRQLVPKRLSSWPMRISMLLEVCIGLCSAIYRCSPGNADLSDEAAGVSNDGAKSENVDIAASAGNAKRRAPNAFLSSPTSGRLFDVLITNHQSPLTHSVFRAITAHTSCAAKGGQW
jgi:hypothetical protein